MPVEIIERRANLALSFQEIFTAIVRLRFDRQSVPSAEMFREHMKQALRTSSQDGAQKGYNADDVKLAAFAVVAFLDESVLASKKPIFSSWPRLPLQEELFGVHIGGEVFFQYLQQLLARRDSAETADLMEVFYLCLLLGYRGRYGIQGSGELRAIMDSVRDKIRRVRGGNMQISPQWAVPAEALPARRADPWVGRLMFGAIGMGLIALIAYVAGQFALASLSSGLHRLIE